MVADISIMGWGFGKILVLTSSASSQVSRCLVVNSVPFRQWPLLSAQRNSVNIRLGKCVITSSNIVLGRFFFKVTQNRGLRLSNDG